MFIYISINIKYKKTQFFEKIKKIIICYILNIIQKLVFSQ